MQDIETTTETPELSEDFSFGKEIAKTALLSVASTAGVLIGFAAVGLAVDKVKKVRAARAAKKDAENTPEEN